MTEEQFGVLIGKLDTLINIARDIDEILIELSCDLTCDNEDNSYRPPIWLGISRNGPWRALCSWW